MNVSLIDLNSELLGPESLAVGRSWENLGVELAALRQYARSEAPDDGSDDASGRARVDRLNRLNPGGHDTLSDSEALLAQTPHRRRTGAAARCLSAVIRINHRPDCCAGLQWPLGEHPFAGTHRRV
jgi:hypothetical protein